MLSIKCMLKYIVDSYKSVLKGNLVGIYLHGSLAMNDFNEESSDIDFLVVIKEKIYFKVMRQLVDVLLNLSKEGPKKGFEMSVILESDAKNFKSPTPFVLHYSDWHKERYINNLDYVCADSVDEDLAAHITILRARGVCIYGDPINNVFAEVPKECYIDSILSDIATAKEEVVNDPIYYILNLCRVICFLKEGKISSKKEGGQWAYEHCGPKYRHIILSAIETHNDIHKEFNIQQELLVEFVDCMMKKINQCCI